MKHLVKFSCELQRKDKSVVARVIVEASTDVIAKAIAKNLFHTDGGLFMEYSTHIIPMLDKVEK